MQGHKIVISLTAMLVLLSLISISIQLYNINKDLQNK